MNPWGVTPREAESMDALLGLGTFKRAADRLGITVQTLAKHLRSARRKMNPPHRLGQFLMWHDWRKAGQEVAAEAVREEEVAV